jgi:hypothetical protein
MSKLPPGAELMILRLDEDDEAGVWLERYPYRRRILALLSSSREVLALKALRRFGVLEHFAPLKRKWGGSHRKADSLDIVADDVRRIKDMRRDDGRKQQRRDDKETAELIAAERHLRIVHGKTGEGEEWVAELRELIEKLHRRLKRSGTTGAERHRAKKRMLCAK